MNELPRVSAIASIRLLPSWIKYHSRVIKVCTGMVAICMCVLDLHAASNCIGAISRDRICMLIFKLLSIHIQHVLNTPANPKALP